MNQAEQIKLSTTFTGTKYTAFKLSSLKLLILDLWIKLFQKTTTKCSKEFCISVTLEVTTI